MPNHPQACHAPLLPVLDECLGIVTKALDPEFNSVCNNASWAIGEARHTRQHALMGATPAPVGGGGGEGSKSAGA